MKRRPIVGISSYPRTGNRPAYGLPGSYVDGIRAAGGSVLILPPGEADPESLLEVVDGLVLSGGGDVAPARYDGNGHEAVYGVSEERDAFEIALAEAALAKDKPLLCICRGMQLLNVTLGGDLHVHLPDLGDTVLEHRLRQSETTHSVSIRKESRLHAILGEERVSVCSWHHQAVRRVAEGLRPVAWAEDGVVEGLEHQSHPFCIAVQWHPEMQLDDPVQQRLFRAFVELCTD